MRFLIIEDDQYKADKVIECLKGHEIEHEKSYNSGLRNLLTEGESYDGIILDMGLPIFEDGDRYDAESGLMILREMKRSDIQIPVLVHSGNEYDVSFYPNVLGYIVAGNYTIDKPVDAFIASISASKKDIQTKKEQGEIVMNNHSVNLKINGFYCMEAKTKEEAKKQVFVMINKEKIEEILEVKVDIEPTDVLESLIEGSNIDEHGTELHSFDTHFIIHAIIEIAAPTKEDAINVLSLQLSEKQTLIEKILCVGIGIEIEGEEIS